MAVNPFKKFKRKMIRKLFKSNNKGRKSNNLLDFNPSLNKNDINVVISHWQALAQCSDYLSNNNYVCKEFFDTSGACKNIQNSVKLCKFLLKFDCYLPPALRCPSAVTWLTVYGS